MKERTRPETPEITAARLNFQVLLAMLFLRDSFTDERLRGIAYEAILQIAFRAWGWNVEKTRDELDLLKERLRMNPTEVNFSLDPDGLVQLGLKDLV